MGLVLRALTSPEPLADDTVAIATGEPRLEEKWISHGHQEIAKHAAEQVEKAAKEAAQRVSTESQPSLDQGKETVRNLGRQASEAGAQAVDRAGELLEGVAPQAKEM